MSHGLELTAICVLVGKVGERGNDGVGDSIHNTLLQWTGKEGLKAGTNGAGTAGIVSSENR